MARPRLHEGARVVEGWTFGHYSSIQPEEEMAARNVHVVGHRYLQVTSAGSDPSKVRQGALDGGPQDSLATFTPSHQLNATTFFAV